MEPMSSCWTVLIENVEYLGWRRKRHENGYRILIAEGRKNYAGLGAHSRNQWNAHLDICR
jgi:hypothetical protein